MYQAPWPPLECPNTIAGVFRSSFQGFHTVLAARIVTRASRDAQVSFVLGPCQSSPCMVTVNKKETWLLAPRTQGDLPVGMTNQECEFLGKASAQNDWSTTSTPAPSSQCLLSKGMVAKVKTYEEPIWEALGVQHTWAAMQGKQLAST